MRDTEAPRTSELFESIQPCWWMLAGVVDYKLCDRKLDCEHCPFDLSLHGLSSRTESHANLDFVLDDTLFYHPAHVWARVEDSGNVRVGMDDLAQNLFGRIYAVSLPDRRASCEEGAHAWSVTHKTGNSNLFVPLSGEVIDVNSRINQSPSLLNREPYDDGWAFMIKPNNLENGLGNLFYGPNALNWHKKECEQLHSLVSAMIGVMPDGGMLRKDFLSALSAEQRLDLIDTFVSKPSGAVITHAKHSAILDSKRR